MFCPNRLARLPVVAGLLLFALTAGGCFEAGVLVRDAPETRIPATGAIDAALAGRPLAVGEVATELATLTRLDSHPLADADYAALMRHELEAAFERHDLGRGEGEPLAVDVTLRRMKFTGNRGFEESHLFAVVELPGVGEGLTFVTRQVDDDTMLGWIDGRRPAVLRMRRQVPASAENIATILENARGGAGITDIDTSMSPWMTLGPTTRHNLTEGEVEAVTGRDLAGPEGP